MPDVSHKRPTAHPAPAGRTRREPRPPTAPPASAATPSYLQAQVEDSAALESAVLEPLARAGSPVASLPAASLETELTQALGVCGPVETEAPTPSPVSLMPSVAESPTPSPPVLEPAAGSPGPSPAVAPLADEAAAETALEEEGAAPETPGAEAPVAAGAQGAGGEGEGGAEGAGPEGGAGAEGAPPPMAAGGTAPGEETALAAVPGGGAAMLGGTGEVEPAVDGLRLPPISAPRLGIETPAVESPPRAAVDRSEEIRKQTGAPPELHHARVRQAVLRVVEVARQAQRQISLRIAALAGDTRVSMEQVADQVPQIVAAAVAYIERQIEEAKRQVGDAATEQIDYIEQNGVLVGERLAESRDLVVQDVHQQLLAGSEEIRQADALIRERFNARVEEAAGNIRILPDTGYATLLPGSEEGPAAPGESAGGAAAGPRTLAEAETNLNGELDNVAYQGARGTYVAARARPILPRLLRTQREDLQRDANERATQVGSEATRAQFALLALGLSAPVARAESQDEPGHSEAVCQSVDAQAAQARTAKEQAQDALREKRNGVYRHLDNALKPQLTKGLRKAGGKAELGLRQQARAAEHGLRGAAASMSEAYRDVVERLKPMLPPGQFLDSNRLEPRLSAALRSAQALHRAQIETGSEQAEEAIKQAQDVLDDQRASLWEAATDGTQGVTDAVTASSVDFAMFAAQYTGTSSLALSNVMGRGQEYAGRIAGNLLRTRDRVDKDGFKPLERQVIGFLNGQILGAEAGYVASVGAFERSFKEPGTGVIAQVTEENDRDLSPRSERLKNALPERSIEGAVASAGAGAVLLPGAGAVVGLGIYLYATDTDEDEVLSTIGELAWPGAPALAEYFNTEAGAGDLRQRIREGMDDPEKQQALNLFSSQAGTRASARLAIAEDSLATFTGPSREAREAVLRGMGAEERGALSAETLRDTTERFRSELRADELTISTAYLEGDTETVLAVRMRQRLDEARREGDDAIAVAMDDVQRLAREELKVHEALVTPERVQALTDAAIRRFPEISGRGGAPGLGFVDYATAMRTEVYGDQVVQVPVDTRVADYVRAVAEHGAQSREAWTARANYEIRHAEAGWGELSDSSKMRLTQALEDPSYYRVLREYESAGPDRRAALEPELARLRGEHERRMQGLATSLGASPEALEAAGGATAWVAGRVGGLFARRAMGEGEEADTRYGTELVTRGRASLALGVRIATRGMGTNEELLRHSYAGRSQAEIAAARSEWQDRYHEDMDVMLGISPESGWFGSEVSGDLAYELEILSLGEPETDFDHARIAALRFQQQRVRGTGFLASLTMSGTPEAESLDSHRAELGSAILSAAGMSGDPASVFAADGSIRPEIAAQAFRDGQFRGDRGHLRELTLGVELASDRYRAEIDRQESMLTSAITAIAIAVSLLLMIVPGVNLVAAGVLTALIAGAATIAVKAGMRGGRYGWEEAATDVATTSIEAATAGIGGAMAGGLGKAGMAGRLAGVGAALEGRLGRVGAIVAREAMTSAASSAAQTAIQDDTWRDGMGSGLLRVVGSGARGAAVAAVSAGVSEGLEGRIGKALDPGLVTDPARMSRLQQVGRALGPAGREMLKEGTSEAIGAVASEGVGIMTDVMSGQFRGGLREAFTRMGQAGLRDLVSGAGRAGARSFNQARYRNMLGQLRAGGELTNDDLGALRRAAISAGEMHYGEGLGGLRSLHREVTAGRAALAELPPALQAHARAFDEPMLQHLRGMLASGDLGSPAARLQLIREIRQKIPDLDARAFLRDLNTANSELRAAEVRNRATDQLHHKRVRNQLVAELEGPLRRSLRDVPIDGIDRLPPAELKRAAEMVARGEFDAEQAAELFRSAKAQDPELNQAIFMRNLQVAAETARLAREVDVEVRAQRRQDVLATVPAAARRIFANLPEESIARVKAMLDQESIGNRQQLDALYRAARKGTPGLEREQFIRFMEDAVATVRKRRAAEARVRREVRQQRLEHLPEDLRTVLSALPDHSLAELRALGMLGAALSPATRQRLVDDAIRESPGTDPRALSAAMDEAMVRGRAEHRISGALEAVLRGELMDAVPASLRQHLEEVPILVMRASDFENFTRSERGQAVTLIVHGRPVVVMREGADPSVLREEGLHVLQAREPQWGRRIGALDERTLAEWDRLPLAEQFALYRNKVEIEIDAQRRLMSDLEARRSSATEPTELAALRQRLDQSRAALESLTRRRTEVAGYGEVQRQAIEANVLRRPDWLDQPARLFSKEGDAGEAAEAARAVEAETDTPSRRLSEALGDLPDEARRSLLALPAEQISALMPQLEVIRSLAAGADPVELRARRVRDFAEFVRRSAGLIPEVRGFLSDLKGDVVALLPHFDTLKTLAALREGESPGEAVHRVHQLVDLVARAGTDWPKGLAEEVLGMDPKVLGESIRLLDSDMAVALWRSGPEGPARVREYLQIIHADAVTARAIADGEADADAAARGARLHHLLLVAGKYRRGGLSQEAFAAMYAEGARYNPRTNRWYTPGADRRQPSRLPHDADPAAVLAILTGPRASYRRYLEMLQRLGLDDADGSQTRKLLEAMHAERGLGGQYEDYVRHRLKEHFAGEVLRRLLHPDPVEMAAKYPGQTYDQARYREMYQIVRDLASSDKGNLIEVWFRVVHAPDSAAHIDIVDEFSAVFLAQHAGLGYRVLAPEDVPGTPRPSRTSPNPDGTRPQIVIKDGPHAGRVADVYDLGEGELAYVVRGPEVIAHGEAPNTTREVQQRIAAGETPRYVILQDAPYAGLMAEVHLRDDGQMEFRVPDLMLGKNRVADLVQGNALRELKSISGRMGEHDLAQFEDYMRIVRSRADISVRGARRRISSGIYTFTLPEGADANFDWMLRQLADPQNRGFLKFEVFNRRGESIFLSSADLAGGTMNGMTREELRQWLERT